MFHVTFYFENDDYKPVDFNNGTISFTCKVNKTQSSCFKKNLNMIRPKIQTEDLILSMTKNCETLIEQTHRKSEETLELRLQKSKKVFHFNPPIQNKGDWMIGLTSLEVYNRFFNITEENNKSELYKFPESKIGGVSYEKVRDEIERDWDISDFTATD